MAEISRLEMVRDNILAQRKAGNVGIPTARELDHLLEIALKAKAVREAQKEYFKSRDSERLMISKRLEAELDQLIREPAPGGLFEEEES